ncbi:MAG TPA: hypothetical protein VKU42_10200, partial [Candidatus Angelobacter sp.]|nr:hypothetical protein [Candidatus Angelobacter sp.]
GAQKFLGPLFQVIGAADQEPHRTARRRAICLLLFLILKTAERVDYICLFPRDEHHSHFFP